MGVAYLHVVISGAFWKNIERKAVHILLRIKAQKIKEWC